MQNGFALPLTLLVIAVLMVLSFGLSQMTTESVEDIRVRRDAVRFELKVEDELNRALYTLLTGSYRERRVEAEGGPTLHLDREPGDSGELTASVQQVGGLYPIGMFSEATFLEVMKQITDERTALAVTGELADWIDEDNNERYAGREMNAYLATGSSATPRNAMIRTLDELLELPSMTPQLFNGTGDVPGVRDLVAAGGASQFNLATAPPQVLGPMLGLSSGEREMVLAARSQQDWSEVSRLIASQLWRLNGPNPFVQSNRFELRFEDDEDRRARIQVKLTPDNRTRIFETVVWQVPDFERRY